MLSIDVADIAKPERDTSDGDGDGEEGSSNGPAQALRTVEEPFSRSNIPTDLEVHGESTNKDPNRH